MLRELYLFSNYLLYNCFVELFFNKKNARNMVALTHASGSVIINLLYLLTGNTYLLGLSLNYSIGYFLYDIFYIFKYDKMNFLRYCYIYHHLGALYIIYHYYLLNSVPVILLAGELSNIPSYFIYHNLHIENKTADTENKIVYYKSIQKYLYGFIRVPVMTYLMYDIITNINLNNPSYFGLLIAGGPIYLMGLAWTYMLVCKK